MSFSGGGESVGIKLSAARDHESKTVWLRSDADGMREFGESLVAAADLVEPDDDRE